MSQVGVVLVQIYSPKEFKSNDGSKKIYSFLRNLGVSQLLMRNINMKSISRHMSNDRKIIVSKKGEQNEIYITTGEFKDRACKILIGDKFFELANITYSRVGNGTNQEATAVVTKLVEKNGSVTDNSYGLKLSLRDQKAVLTYFGDLTNLSNGSFSIEVDPNTLDGFGEESRITDTLNNHNALDIFRISYLEGNNRIDDKNIFSRNVDLKFLEHDKTFIK